MLTSLSLLLFSALSHLTLTTATPSTPTPAPTPTPPPDPTQLSKLSSYFSSLTAQPAYTSIASIIATAMPDSLVESIENSAGTNATTAGGADPGGFLFGTRTQNVLTTQSWFTALPTEVKGYFSSVVAEERVLLGAKKSEARKGAGGGCAWGVVGLMGVLGWL